jgi:NAD(P)-dependent dehydrogenase (short-subunit alcohol dehydrogenase family)
MEIKDRIALVTGAASGIGQAVAFELASRGAKTVILVDRRDEVYRLADSLNSRLGRQATEAKIGDATNDTFRAQVYDQVTARHGVVTICVPAAGITRDALAVSLDKATGRANPYSITAFREVTEVNLVAPVYWAIEMVARIAEERWKRDLKQWQPQEEVQGAVVFIGSVSSLGNKGQIAYAVSKAGLEGAAATLMKEAMYYGVRCGIIHPGFTDTPMVRNLGEEFIAKNILPFTQLRRLIRPVEIADAICFMVSNPAVSGQLWADAGWHPPA